MPRKKAEQLEEEVDDVEAESADDDEIDDEAPLVDVDEELDEEDVSIEADTSIEAPEDLDEDEDTDEADDEEEGDASLEELKFADESTRASRRTTDEVDTGDIMALASERDDTLVEELRTKVIPIQDRQEFVCARCHLVKARSQLADAERRLCRDCV